MRKTRPAVDCRYPNIRLSGKEEWATERIIVIPAEKDDIELARKEIRMALEWLLKNLDDAVMQYDSRSVYEIGYLRSPEHGEEMDAERIKAHET